MHLKTVSLKISCLLIAMAIIPSVSFAFFCPTNFTQIDYGNTIEQVQQQCGKPDKIEIKELKKEGPQEWNYFIPQTVASNTMNPVQGTLKTQVMFDKDGKAINISVNGIGVGSTLLCGNTMVQLGDTRESIKKRCGDPSFINKQETPSSGSEAQSTKQTIFTYNTNPPISLVFENGKLVEKK